MTYIQERGSTHVYHVNRMSKEEIGSYDQSLRS